MISVKNIEEPQNTGDPELPLLEREFQEVSDHQKLPLGLKLARALLEHGAFERTLQVLEQIRRLAQTDDEVIAVLRSLGQTHLRLSQYQKAYLHLGEALNLLSCRPGSLELFQVYHDIAWMFYRQGYLDNARSYLEGARMTLECLGDGLSRQQTELLHLTALIEAAAGNHDLAAANLQMEAGFHRRNGDERRLAAVYNKLASVTYTRGDIAGALEYQATAHSLAEKVGDSFRLALSHKNHGDIYFILGDLTTAMDHFRLSDRLCRSIGNGLGQVFALDAMGRIMAAGGENPEAKSYFDRALEMARQMELRDREASILVNLAEWHCLQGRPEAAQESLRLASNIEMMRGQASSPRHQVILARSLLLASGLHGAVEAQRLLEHLLAKPLKLDDEQMTAVPELEAQARFLLADSWSRQGLKDRGEAETDRAASIIKDLVKNIPPAYRENYLSKPLTANILGKKNC
jgi:tetratricopeptide (TPR) repeat protein